MDTLPDLINDDTHLLSIGLNPSLPSVDAGFYFANPRNRFWTALNLSGVFPEPLEPSLDSCQHLVDRFHIGFTDLVKRPTAGCKDLNAADYREGSKRLDTMIEDVGAKAVWFHGKLTCQKYVQYSANKNRSIVWGKQPWLLNNNPVFITPNPSPANAAYSLKDISDSYQAMFQQLALRPAC